MYEKVLSRRVVYEEHAPQKSFQIRRRRTWLALTLLLAASISTLYLVDNLRPFYTSSRQWLSQKTSEFNSETITKVPLEAHIMSKCPDAKDCLRDLIIPTMANVSDKVDFTLSFIGTPTDDDDGVDCKHGPQECLGNILELCAASIYPDPKIYLGFAMCLTGHYEEIPQRELISDCSLEHGMDFERLNDCVSKDDGAYGIDLLRHSVVRTAEAGVTKSCTVRLKNQIRTIRDGGRWKDYEGGHDVGDLISDIKRLYQASDEEWVPRRVPQPANAKASNSKTAKAHKPTRIPTLYNARPKGPDGTASLSEAQSILPAEPNDPAEPNSPIEPLTSSDFLTEFEVPTITTPSYSTLITSTLDQSTITTPSIGASAHQPPELLTSISTELLSAYEPSDLPGEAVQEF
ncbi:hypothetical protein EV356DRAFT_10936 [Viridothelium virens]|uniref:Gamma interferon inducible lysosomal thiol reductase n=1 Tax=Viridothelium virens TaxID=1048519 RepID=A0A6A6HRP3_VIRVR|nr:hypothetical protein EV356DRAFT_10936 [Viridothelium virens]